jgi:rhamnogalacturonan endolyase
MEMSRRQVIVGAAGAAAATALIGGQKAAASGGHDDVQVLINGAPAAPGTYAFPAAVDALVLDNGLIRFTFTRDDAAGGIVTGWSDVSITASSIVVDGVELAHNLNGVEPRDPDRQHSFYIDAGGGRTRLVCTEVRVLRASPDLVEVVFADTASTQLRHEHHLVMRRGRRGLYGYNILTAVVAQSINEVRMNTRWDRSILDHAYNWERGGGQQPTYAYLATQTSVQDETWRVDGVNNPSLPSPASNSGNLPAGTVYTKYNWSLYHHENPMFGHYGNGFGVWLTPLGGVTDDTLCAFYGAGPNHQDLAIHQDALILNYFGINHYGEPAYPLPAGYQRLYGPWFNFVTVGETDTIVAQAAAVARHEIDEHRAGARWIEDPFYPSVRDRTTVTGRLRIADGRPPGNFWVLVSTQDIDDVFAIHEPTYFVKTAEDGRFVLPGIPPAWQPGTKTPGTYTLYVFDAGGSITDQYKQSGITVGGRVQNLGDIVFTPTNHTTFLWQIGGADRTGGEFALAARPEDHSNPRAFEKPAAIPAELTFNIGTSWEPRDWYYAQANAGTWTIAFTLDRAYTGTAFLTVSSSLQAGNRPTIAVNGTTDGITGTLPANNDSTIGRQADRSGFPRRAVLSFPAERLVAGPNTVTLTRQGTGGGMGWDTILLEVDEPVAPSPAKLRARLIRRRPQWTIEVTNTGTGPANDVRLAAIEPIGRAHPGDERPGRDPRRFPVPVAASLPPGGTATIDLPASHTSVRVTFTANGERVRTTLLAG